MLTLHDAPVQAPWTLRIWTDAEEAFYAEVEAMGAEEAILLAHLRWPDAREVEVLVSP